MYVNGIISEVMGYKAKIKIPEFDDFETNWLYIPQLFTVRNKSGYKPEIGALVSAVLDDNMTSGAILGQIYNDIDSEASEMAGAEFIRFSDGVEVYHFADSNQLFVSADILCLDVNKLIVMGDIQGNKTLNVTGDISSDANVSDLLGSMQKMRNTYNSHLHMYDQNIPTTVPVESMT